jgi:hypothetical protein
MNGKFVLGLAATVVTVGSSLAFKAHWGNGGNKSVGKTANGHCFQCKSLYSSSGGIANTKCKTAAGVVTIHGFGSAKHTWYTQTVNNGGNHCPSNPVVRTKTTINS